MKNIIRLFAVLIWVSVLLVGCGGSSTSSAPTTTVLVYLEGTDLESRDAAAQNNITEMLAATSAPGLKIVLTTGAADKAVPGEDVDNWREVRRWVVGNHKLIESKSKPGVVDMGDPKVLTDFITWGQDNYPADKYVLVFWDHGGGTLGGFGGNTPNAATDPMSSSFASGMSLAQLKVAVDNAVQGRANRKFELIGFDACLMATLEVANAFKDTARFLAASQELEPGAGWNWTAFLSQIATNPGTDGASMGATIADAYGAKMNAENTGAMITFSVTDLSRIARVNTALAALATKYTTLLSGSNSLTTWNSLASSRSHALDFSQNFELVDLNAMFNNSVLVDIGLAEGTELVNATQDAVVKKVSGPYRKGASGLSVIFPSFSVWTPSNQLSTYSRFDFVVPQYQALLNAFATYARTSVKDMTFGVASLSGDSKTMSVRISSPTSAYEQVYVAVKKQIDTVIDGKTIGTQDIYLGHQPVWSSSGDTRDFSYRSDAKWFTLNGKLASVIAEPTTQKGVQIIKIPMRVERTNGKPCAPGTCSEGMYYIAYNFDTDAVDELIGYVADANNQVSPADQLKKDDVIFLKYFAMPDSADGIGSWLVLTDDAYKFTVGAVPVAFEKTALPLGSSFAFFGLDLRWKQFVSNAVKLQ